MHSKTTRTERLNIEAGRNGMYRQRERTVYSLALSAAFPQRKANGLFASALLLLLFTGCQRELSLENGPVAKGSLQANTSGDCLPKTINGLYKAGTSLGSGNTVEVTVDVTAPGNYTIATNTVNGYSFSGAGTFASTGSFVVTLQGKG